MAVRSHTVGLTWDEISMLDFALDLSWEGITHSAGVHLLSAFLVRSILELGHSNEFVIRLPGLFAYLAFAWGLIEVGRYVQRGAAVVLFLFLILNPFILDFFSLARGYGLALGAMMPSMAFAIRYCAERRPVWIALSLLCGMLAVVASYTMLNYFLGLSAILALWVLFEQRPFRERMDRFSLVALSPVVFTLALLPILITLNAKGEFYFGGREDLYTDTIRSLGRCFAYHADHGAIASTSMILIVLFGVGIALVDFIRSIISRSFGISEFVSWLLLAVLFAAILQHALLGTSFPVERTGLVFYPLVGMVVIHGMMRIHERFNRALQLGVGVLMVGHFLSTANLTHTYSWRYESGSKHLVDHLRERMNGDYRLGVDFVHVQSLSYYRNERGSGSLNVHGMTECWEFCLGLEELNPNYFGVKDCAKELDAQALEELLDPNMDGYYLDDTYLAAMDEAKVRYSIVERYPFSRTSLIELDQP